MTGNRSWRNKTHTVFQETLVLNSFGSCNCQFGSHQRESTANVATGTVRRAGMKQSCRAITLLKGMGMKTDNLYSVISYCESAIAIIKDSVKCNSQRYEWCQNAERHIERAKKELEDLRNK